MDPFDDLPRGEPLTLKERLSAHLASQGFTNAEIAEKLETTEPVVAGYISRAVEKLGVTDRLDLMNYVALHGIKSSQARSKT